MLFARLVMGAIFIYAGYMKIFVMGMAEVTTMFGEGFGFPAPAFFAWLTAVAELVCGVMLVLGLWAQLAAAVLMIVMLVALFVVHVQNGFDQGTQYVLAIMAALGAIMTVGAGKWALCVGCPCPGGKKCCDGDKCEK